MKLSQIVDGDNNNHHPYTDQAAETHYNNDANNITPLPFLPFPSLPLPSPLEKKNSYRSPNDTTANNYNNNNSNDNTSNNHNDNTSNSHNNNGSILL
jgi:hypothetical protein